MKIVAGLVLSALLGSFVLQQRAVVSLDFRAFYCAGAALRHHQNPYHTASLRTCELNDTDDQYRARLPGTTLPAPQPLYDIVLFSLFSLMPFAVAKTVWGAVLGAAIFLSAISLAELAGLSAPLVLAVLSTALIGNTLALGQIVPIYFAAACGAAVLMKAGRPAWAGAAAAVSLIEPHLGLPICLSLALWSPASRLTLGAGAALLATAAFFAGGIGTNVEYFHTVLPLHALSELGSDGQLSLSVILYALHVADAQAVEIGSLSYVVASGAGVWLGRALMTRLRNRAYFVAVPAAASILGGSFLHGTDVIAAIPLALMVAAIPRYRILGTVTAVLLATPWSAQSNAHEMVAWFALAAATATYVLVALGRVQPLWSAMCGVLIFCTLCEVNFWYERVQLAYVREPRTLAVRIDETYPQAGWERVNQGTYWTESTPAWEMRAPTWAGLLLLGFAAMALTARPARRYAKLRDAQA